MIGALLVPALLAAQMPAPAATPAPPTAIRRDPADPFQRFNRGNFRRQQKFDHRFLRPAALGYSKVVPRPVRQGLANFFSNLGEPLVFVSYLLELKPGKAIETAGRFMINSTLGLGGLVDVAAQPRVKLRHRDNSLADALGYYGVKPGPYLFLPLIGPTTVRDLIAGQTEAAFLPIAAGGPFSHLTYQVPRGVTTGLETRANADQDLQALLADAVDPYATFKSVWLQDRQGEIDALHGKPRRTPAAPELGEPLADPAGSTRPPAAATTPELSDPLADPASGATPATPSAAQPAPTPSAAPELNDPLTDPAAKP